MPAQLDFVSVFAEDVSISGALDVATEIDLYADTLAVGASVAGAGTLRIESNTEGLSIGIGDSAAGTLNLTNAEIAYFQDGFSGIAIGGFNAGTATVNAVTFTTDPVTIEGDQILVNGQITGSDDASVTLREAPTASTTYLSADIVTHGNPVLIDDVLRVSGDRTIDTTNGGVFSGGNVTFQYNFDSGTSGSLTIDAGAGDVDFLDDVDGSLDLTVNSAGVTTFHGDIGDTTPLTSLTTDAGGSTQLNGDGPNIVTTSGDMNFGDATTITDNGPIISSSGGSITFDSTLDPSGSSQLFVSASSGTVTANAAIGSVTPFVLFRVASPFNFNGGTIDALANQTYNAQVTLGADTTLTASGGSGDLQFSGNVDGPHDLTVDVNGTIVVSGDISLTTTGSASLTAARNIVLNSGSSITTVDGDLTLTANQAATATDSFIGIALDNATVTTTTGAITIDGTGSASGSPLTNMKGIQLLNGAVVSSSGTGPSVGTVTLTGVGGASAGSDGIYAEGPTTLVTTVDGDIVIDGSSTGGEGVQFNGASFVTSTGTGADAGTIAISGTGSGVQSTVAFGVFFGPGLNIGGGITSVDGDINVTGTSSLATAAGVGVRFEDSYVTSTGTGPNAAKITITGESTSPVPTQAQGVSLNGPQVLNNVSSVDGDISITGTSAVSQGVIVWSSQVISSGTGADAANISLVGSGGADGVLIQSGSDMISSIDGDVSITGAGTGATADGVYLRSTSPQAVRLTGDANLTLVGTKVGGAGQFGVNVNSPVNIPADGASGDIAISADTVSITAAVTSTGALTIKPLTPNTSIGLGGGVGTLNLGASDLANLADGFDSITIGDATGSVSSQSFVDSGQTLGTKLADDVLIGDLDGDGDLDAFAVNRDLTGGPGLSVFLNDSTGTFVDTAQSLGNNNSFAGSLGDLDGDGDLDALVSNFVAADQIWLNDGTGTFTAGATLAKTGNGRAIALADVDSDGDLDAITGAGFEELWINQGGTQSGTEGVFVKADTADAFGTFVRITTDIAPSDIDNDGDIDVVISYSNNDTRVHFNQGGIQGGTEGTFAFASSLTGSANAMAIELGDVNGDGYVDAFVGRGQPTVQLPSKVYLNDGNGAFVDTGQDLAANPNQPTNNIFRNRDVKLGDLDNDGDLDAFLANSSNNSVYLNDGLGSFTGSGQVLTGPLTDYYSVALGDVDEDGFLDAFVGVNGANNVWVNDTVFEYTSGDIDLDTASFLDPVTIAGSNIDVDDAVLNATNDLITLKAQSGGTVDLVASGVRTFDGTISGAGGLAVTNGNVSLTGNNTFSGGTSISTASTARVFTNDALGTGSVTVAAGGFLGLNDDITVANSLTLEGASGTGALANTTGNNTFTGDITLSSASGILTNPGTTLTIDGNISLGANTLTTTVNGDLNITGVMSGSNSIISKDGSGTLSLSGNNTNAGQILVNAGMLKSGAADVIHNSTLVNLASGTTFDLNDFDEQVLLVKGDGNVTLGSGDLTVAFNGLDYYHGSIRRHWRPDERQRRHLDPQWRPYLHRLDDRHRRSFGSQRKSSRSGRRRKRSRTEWQRHHRRRHRRIGRHDRARQQPGHSDRRYARPANRIDAGNRVGRREPDEQSSRLRSGQRDGNRRRQREAWRDAVDRQLRRIHANVGRPVHDHRQRRQRFGLWNV